MRDRQRDGRPTCNTTQIIKKQVTIIQLKINIIKGDHVQVKMALTRTRDIPWENVPTLA